MKKINCGIRLIGLRLDHCEVPETLKHLAWQEISDLENYDGAFTRIVKSILGQYDKPPLGPQPAYVRAVEPNVSGLAPIDNKVFLLCCERALELPYLLVERDWLVSKTQELGLTLEEVVDAQEVLANRGYLKIHRRIGPRHIHTVTLTERAFHEFARTLPEYQDLVDRIKVLIVQDKVTSSFQMAEKSGVRQSLVNDALFVLAKDRMIRTDTQANGEIYIMDVSPELRRTVQL